MFASSSSSFAAATSFKNSVRANNDGKNVKQQHQRSSSLVVRAEVGKGQGIIIIII